MLSVEELMGLSDPVMNNQTICLGIRVLENQKYVNKDCGIAIHISYCRQSESFAFLVSRLGVG